MKTIVISQSIRKEIPTFSMGILTIHVDVENNRALDLEIENLEKQINETYELKDVLQIPNILAARNGYKRLGKDPSRYRLAVESLYRRIVKGNHLYRINNVVDIGNILSLKASKSVAVLDYDKIVGDILIRKGTNEHYEGIGRGVINVENIPVYVDDIGPFGSTTSDTERTMITDNTKKVLVFIISFNGNEQLEADCNLAIDLYKRFANAYDFEYTII